MVFIENQRILAISRGGGKIAPVYCTTFFSVAPRAMFSEDLLALVD